MAWHSLDRIFILANWTFTAAATLKLWRKGFFLERKIWIRFNKNYTLHWALQILSGFILVNDYKPAGQLHRSHQIDSFSGYGLPIQRVDNVHFGQDLEFCVFSQRHLFIATANVVFKKYVPEMCTMLSGEAALPHSWYFRWVYAAEHISEGCLSSVQWGIIK